MVEREKENQKKNEKKNGQQYFKIHHNHTLTVLCCCGELLVSVFFFFARHLAGVSYVFSFEKYTGGIYMFFFCEKPRIGKKSKSKQMTVFHTLDGIGVHTSIHLPKLPVLAVPYLAL